MDMQGWVKSEKGQGILSKGMNIYYFLSAARQAKVGIFGTPESRQAKREAKSADILRKAERTMGHGLDIYDVNFQVQVARYAEREQKLKKLQPGIDKAEGLLDAAQKNLESVQAVQAQMNAMMKKWEDLAKVFDDDITSLTTAKITKIDERIVANKADIGFYNAKIAESTNHISINNSEIKRLKTEISANGDVAGKKQKEINTLKDKNEALQKEIQTFQGKAEQLNKSNNGLEKLKALITEPKLNEINAQIAKNFEKINDIKINDPDYINNQKKVDKIERLTNENKNLTEVKDLLDIKALSVNPDMAKIDAQIDATMEAFAKNQSNYETHRLGGNIDRLKTIKGLAENNPLPEIDAMIQRNTNRIATIGDSSDQKLIDEKVQLEKNNALLEGIKNNPGTEALEVYNKEIKKAIDEAEANRDKLETDLSNERERVEYDKTKSEMDAIYKEHIKDDLENGVLPEAEFSRMKTRSTLLKERTAKNAELRDRLQSADFDPYSEQVTDLLTEIGKLNNEITEAVESGNVRISDVKQATNFDRQMYGNMSPQGHKNMRDIEKANREQGRVVFKELRTKFDNWVDGLLEPGKIVEWREATGREKKKLRNWWIHGDRRNREQAKIQLNAARDPGNNTKGIKRNNVWKTLEEAKKFFEEMEVQPLTLQHNLELFHERLTEMQVYRKLQPDGTFDTGFKQPGFYDTAKKEFIPMKPDIQLEDCLDFVKQGGLIAYKTDDQVDVYKVTFAANENTKIIHKLELEHLVSGNMEVPGSDTGKVKMVLGKASIKEIACLDNAERLYRIKELRKIPKVMAKAV